MAEAGMQLIHPTAFNFKKLVLNGEWSQAVKVMYLFLQFSKTFPENWDKAPSIGIETTA